jgi:hypothetical protein
MKLFGKVSIGVLSVALWVPAMMHGQDEPKKDEPKNEEARPQDEAKPPKQDQAKPESKQDEMKPPKQDKSAPSKDNEGKPAAEQPAQAGGTQATAKANGNSGARIPDKTFRSHFGRAHTVVINQPVIVEGQPRFQYGGYWFIISDPWPTGWLYTDQCYIDYVDGEYVLFDLLHPGVSIVLIVVA